MNWLLLFGLSLYIVRWFLFRSFEEGTPLHQRLAWPLILFGMAGHLSATYGPGWALALLLTSMTLGLLFHAWWTGTNGIDFFRPEPQARYGALRRTGARKQLFLL
jgi:hypothetical protein